MTRKPWPWNRLLWGVTLTGKDELPILLGSLWHTRRSYFDYEPTRPLLFVTRARAAAWCKDTNARYRARTDACRHWRFRPVRVREIVRIEP